MASETIDPIEARDPLIDVRQTDAWRLLCVLAEDRGYISTGTAAKLLAMSTGLVKNAIRDGDLEGFNDRSARGCPQMVSLRSLVAFLNRIHDSVNCQSRTQAAAVPAHLAGAEA